MKLYIFEGCPFCTRARMLVGLKGIECEVEYVLADDVETPTRMIGKKAVPILKKDDGSYLGESWAINAYLDGLVGEPVLDEVPKENFYENWYNQHHVPLGKLAYPRMLKAEFPEIRSEGAQTYLIEYMKKLLGQSVDEILAETDVLRKEVEPLLEELVPHLNLAVIDGGEVTMDDFTLYPMLRPLTLVKGLQLPEQLKAYLETVSKRTKVPLHYDVAV